jgi:phosphodiesterase/alkaline phosphatase D-like protein
MSNDDDPVNLPFLKKYRFPQGVMAADPKPDSIILWTRVVDRLMMMILKKCHQLALM